MKKGNIIGTILGVATGIAINRIVVSNKLMEKDKKIEKFKAYYNLLNKWLSIKQEGKTLEKYFIEQNYRTIAIYGMGELGKRLYEDLRNSCVVVNYAIDKNIVETASGLLIVKPESKLKAVDAIVITSIFDYEAVEEDLGSKTEGHIVSLEDVIYMCD